MIMERGTNMELRKLLEHCYKTVPYYRKLFSDYVVDLSSDYLEEEVAKLPVLNKEKIIIDPDSFLSSKYAKDNLIREYTSGSTGEPATIFKSYIDKIISGKALWKHRAQYHISPSDFFVRFHMVAVDDNDQALAQRVIFRENSLSFSLLHLNKEDIQEYYRLLYEYKVKWIFGAPSAILFIAKYINEYKLPKLNDLKYIEVSGEFQTDAAKEQIRKAFGCEVADLYGLREVYGVALSCPEGTYHLIEENVFSEVVDDAGNLLPDGKEGNLLITSLNNTAMPFIRYETGDRCRMIKHYVCSCGIQGTILELNGGRVTDYLKFKDGRILSSCVFYLAVGEMNIIYNNIIVQFQVIQWSDEDFELKLNMANNNVSHEVLENAYINFITAFGMPMVKWIYSYVDYITIDKATGKHRYYINMMGRTDE